MIINYIIKKINIKVENHDRTKKYTIRISYWSFFELVVKAGKSSALVDATLR